MTAPEYFGKNYGWNLAAWLALAAGGQHSEVHGVSQKLQADASSDPKRTEEAWGTQWTELADRLITQAKIDEDAGHLLSAGNKYSRAAIYLFTGERDLSPQNPEKLDIYRTGLAAFRKGIEFRQRPAEFIEVPFRDSSLPAVFVPGDGEGKRPCLVHFNGADGIKEQLYEIIAEPYRKRGISLLIVDNPGVGGALRLHDLTYDPSTEEPARACLDYLEERADVDGGRVGIAGWSLGGYSAPRAAALENGFSCCVAWGALWSALEVLAASASSGEGQGLSDAAAHYQWMTGTDTMEQAAGIAQRAALEGVIGKLNCPLLIVHGADDVQVGVDQARKTYDGAVNSSARLLKVFNAAEGGSAHCNLDNPSAAVDFMADWVAETLG
jgi:dipeptidyl aminopeptidase/acylaminoacyl peptidase